MKTLLTMLGLSAVLLLGCGSPAPVSDANTSAEPVNKTTLASISPENQATAVYAVKGMT